MAGVVYYCYQGSYIAVIRGRILLLSGVVYYYWQAEVVYYYWHAEVVYYYRHGLWITIGRDCGLLLAWVVDYCRLGLWI